MPAGPGVGSSTLLPVVTGKVTSAPDVVDLVLSAVKLPFWLEACEDDFDFVEEDFVLRLPSFVELFCSILRVE